jgi:energy-coupling factor transport system permease protein
MHPAAWWVWAVGLAVAAQLAGDLVTVTLLAAGVVVVALARRERGGAGLGPYLVLAAVVLATRLVVHVLLGLRVPGAVLIDLPSVALPAWVGLTLLGPVTVPGLAAATLGGMRLAALVLCLGAAVTLADPVRLLRTLPAALHQLATAVVIGVGVAPALVAAAASARRARRLRGMTGRGWAALRDGVVPLLTDAVDRSLALAASMDVRGYARTSGRPDRRVAPLLLAALTALTLGVYAILTASGPAWVGWGCVALAAGLAAGGGRLAGAVSRRTRYRVDRWSPAGVGVAAAGLLAAIVGALRPGALWPALALVVPLVVSLASRQAGRGTRPVRPGPRTPGVVA